MSTTAEQHREASTQKVSLTSPDTPGCNEAMQTLKNAAPHTAFTRRLSTDRAVLPGNRLRLNHREGLLLSEASGSKMRRMRCVGAQGRTCGSKPMSSMRSASSSARKRQLLRLTRARSIRSLSRPGVATRMSHPRSISRSCDKQLTY